MKILDVQELTEIATRMRAFWYACIRVEYGKDFFGALAVAAQHIDRAASLHAQVFNGVLYARLYHALFDFNLFGLLSL